MHRWILLGIVLLCWQMQLAHAVSFNNVVTLGDSLQDDTSGGRSPVAAEHIAERLGVSVTKFAESGSTSSELISDGQHTQAAAQFGSGDLAMLWIGGNDFFTNPFEVAFADSDFLDVLEANVDTVMSTLNNAGMEIVAFNLPDMSQVPGVIDAVNAATILTPFLRGPAFDNITEETIAWNNRLNALATTYGATVVDVFSLFNELADDPGDFAILDNDPILNTDSGCQLCVFFDDLLLPDVHPSSFAQGYIANEAIEQINAVYDPSGTMPLELLSSVEIALLAELYAGDFDDSGDVGATDLTVLQNNYGTSADATHAMGDADGDDDVDGADWMVAYRQFGSNQGSFLAAGVVPEPNALALALLGAIANFQIFRHLNRS